MVAITHSDIAPSTRPLRNRPPVGRAAPSAATYRRRRLVAAGLAVLLFVSLLNLALGVLGEGTGAGDPRPVVELSVLIEPGDTVWSVAESVAGDRDVRPVVDAIVEANGGADLRVGDRLVLVLP